MSKLQFKNIENGIKECFRNKWYVIPVEDGGATRFTLKDRYGWVRAVDISSVSKAMEIAEDLEEHGSSDENVNLHFTFSTDRIRLPKNFPVTQEQEFEYGTSSNGPCYRCSLTLKDCKVRILEEREFSFMGKNYQLIFKSGDASSFPFVQIAEC